MSIFNVHSIVSAILHLKRKCPKCRREQIVPASDRHKVVRCKYCGEPVPPPKRE